VNVLKWGHQLKLFLAECYFGQLLSPDSTATSRPFAACSPQRICRQPESAAIVLANGLDLKSLNLLKAPRGLALQTRALIRANKIERSLRIPRHMDGRSRRLLLVAIIASIVLIYIYPLTLPTPLMDPDEGLHATIAQEMVERGDYLVPRISGEPFRDKPFLYFAAQAASLRMFGMNEAAIRLPGFLFALLGCATTALLARRLFDAETALYAALAALTLVLPVALAQSAAHDIALVPWINLLVLCYWEQENATTASQRWRWVAGGAVCVALALLTKGLIGIAVVTSGIAIYAVVTRSLSWSLLGRCMVVLLAGGALASPWFLRMEHVSPGYSYYYFVQRHFLGFVTEGQEHGDVPWHYYIGPVLGGAMPWLAYAAAAVWQLKYDATRKSFSRPTLLLLCWFLGGFLFLSVAGSKLLTYSLPLFPPIAVLAGLAFRRFFHRELAPIIRRTFIASFRISSFFGMIAPVAALLFLHYFLEAPSPPAAYAVALLASALMGVAFVLFERDRSRTSFAIGMLWFPVSFVCVMAWPMQHLAEVNSQRSLEREVSSAEHLPQQLLLVGERVGSFMFYLSPAQRKWFQAGRVREAEPHELLGLIPTPPGTTIAVSKKVVRYSKRSQAILELNPPLAGKFYVIASQTKPVAVAERPEPGKK
jgi:4-amino-4-deoxy-L-arabinose transferase-like glycosyltransferase